MTLSTAAAPGNPLGGGSLPTQIHELLEEAIIAGDLAPGSRLRADEIAAHYGVSRIPVREAFSALAEAGWVDSRPRYGVYVRGRSRDELAELFEARAGLEQEIARLAASRRSDADLARMDGVVERSRRAVEARNTSGLTDAAIEFNAALRDAGKNAVLTGLSLNLEKRARFYFSPVADLLGEEWITGQERLLGLLRAGDENGSAASARRHIEETGRAVAGLLDSAAFTS
ncbi:GntR family transcriptional regulator [uncultured Microbacterium sp.]|uniref:GntR family transcriptional regulator n=1 Tax=uncultured Microbacterium sp. TaxID=191216 RepID=UPI0035CB5B95